MCRYAMYGPYKQHYACFQCRKAFKWPLDARQRPPKEQSPEAVKCPQCGEPMAGMGLDFRPPRQRDTRQWQKVELLFLRGYTYHSCGCGGPGYRPRTLREVREFLASLGPRSEGLGEGGSRRPRITPRRPFAPLDAESGA
ncbi:hypothetical protein [Hyalangium versicolor]|uniref:hypothetical protein n=1 Tax=Hyalangium versicolor TaxID=2861190 RepID=UPI001CCB1E57|nr:hypothetical protein [Hyalangium versicolor]